MNEDDSQSDPHPEAGLFRSQTTQNSGPEVGPYSIFYWFFFGLYLLQYIDWLLFLIVCGVVLSPKNSLASFTDLIFGLYLLQYIDLLLFLIMCGVAPSPKNSLASNTDFIFGLYLLQWTDLLLFLIICGIIPSPKNSLASIADFNWGWFFSSGFNWIC